MRLLRIVKMEKTQQLERFIEEFLPRTGEKRKYPTNSIEYIHMSINRIFVKKIDVEITEREMIDCFLTLGYNFFTKINKDATNIRIPKIEGFYEAIYEEKLKIRQTMYQDPHEIYVEVSAKQVRELKGASLVLPFDNGNPEKTVKPRAELQSRINYFFFGVKEIREEDYKR